MGNAEQYQEFSNLSFNRRERKLLRKFKEDVQIHESKLSKYSKEIKALLHYEFIEKDSYGHNMYGKPIEAETFSLTEHGKRYKLFKIEKLMYLWIPITISILALIISVVALFFQFMEFRNTLPSHHLQKSSAVSPLFKAAYMHISK